MLFEFLKHAVRFAVCTVQEVLVTYCALSLFLCAVYCLLSSALYLPSAIVFSACFR
jgi:hypothetical protein